MARKTGKTAVPKAFIEPETKPMTKPPQKMVEVWRKTSGKLHYRENGEKKVITPGMTMEFPLDMGPDTKGDLTWELVFKPEVNSAVALKVVRRKKGQNWFDVVRSDTGKPINTKALKIDEALAMAGTNVIDGEDDAAE